MKEPRVDIESRSTQVVERIRTNPPITVSISLRTIVVIFAILFAVWVVRELSGTLVIFATAILLAAAIDKPATALTRRGVSRGLAVMACFVVAVLVGAMLVLLLVPLISEEVNQLSQNLPAYTSDIEHIVNRFHRGDGQTSFSFDSVMDQADTHLQEIAGQLTSVTIEIGHIAITVFATLVIAVMMAMNPRAATTFSRRFLSDPTADRLQKITGDVDHRIGSWVRGQMLVAVSFGLFFGLGLGIIGIPFAATLGIIAAALEVIPYLGGAVTLAMSLVVALSVGVPQAIAVVVLYIVLVNVESHILAPLLIGDAVGLPSVIVLGALFIGIETKGIVGVLLAVPLVLVIAAILDEFWPGPTRDEDDGALQKVEGWIARLFRHRSTRRQERLPATPPATPPA